MTILLDVIAVCRVPDDEVPPAPAPEPEEPTLPAAVPASSGVYLIHVAPSPRLDPSANDLGNVEIVDDLDSVEIVDGALDEPIKKFLID